MRLKTLARIGLTAIAVSLAAAPAHSETLLDRSFPTTGARVLQMNTGGGDVLLVPQSDRVGGVRVVVERNGSAPAPRLDSSRSGNRFVLSLTAQEHSLVPFAAASSTVYRVEYPAAMRLDLRADSGQVSISGSTAPVEVYDQDGNVTVTGSHGPVTVENAHGSITVTGAYGVVDIAADAGDVTATLASGWSGNEIRMQAANGNVSLAVPASFRGRFDPTSGKGSIHNEFGPSNAKAPLVWLYAPAGEVWITLAK